MSRSVTVTQFPLKEKSAGSNPAETTKVKRIGKYQLLILSSNLSYGVMAAHNTLNIIVPVRIWIGQQIKD